MKNQTVTRWGKPFFRLVLRPWSSLLLMVGVLPLIAAPPPPLPPLSKVPDSQQIPGKFVWADLVTDDVAAVLPFYAHLFGWKFSETAGYTVAFKDERPVAGIFQRPRPQDRSAEPRWFGYISVPNVRRTQRAVTAAGGRVLAPPQNMPRRGDQAIFADPEGAMFGVVKSSSGDPPDYLAEPGEWIWIQLLSRDPLRATGFYQTIAGYDILTNSVPGRLSDYVLAKEGYARATIGTISGKFPKLKPTWLPFVRVKSVAESVSQVGTLDGKVVIAPAPGLLGGRVAVVADPTGSAIGILEWSEDLMTGDR